MNLDQRIAIYKSLQSLASVMHTTSPVGINPQTYTIQQVFLVLDGGWGLPFEGTEALDLLGSWNSTIIRRPTAIISSAAEQPAILRLRF
jgi:hypothetical protein